MRSCIVSWYFECKGSIISFLLATLVKKYICSFSEKNDVVEIFVGPHIMKNDVSYKFSFLLATIVKNIYICNFSEKIHTVVGIFSMTVYYKNEAS